jgi:hypothetical protein
MARVTSFVSPEQALAATQAVEAQLGAKISPSYLSLPHVAAEGYPNSSFKTLAAIPQQMTVKIGDVVELNARYRDAGLPCHFIPWTINRLVDAAVAGAPAAAPTQAQNTTATPGPPQPPQTIELTRFVAVGQKLRVDFLYDIEADCSSKGQTTVRILAQPVHGMLAVEKGQGFTNFPKDNQRYECNTRKSDGTFVFYEPKSDYTGTDSIALYIIYPSGSAQTRRYSIEVK